MITELLKEALQVLQEIQEELKDSRLDDSILLVQGALRAARTEVNPMTDEQARDIFRKLPKGWRPLEFARAIEKFHDITGRV